MQRDQNNDQRKTPNSTAVKPITPASRYINKSRSNSTKDKGLPSEAKDIKSNVAPSTFDVASKKGSVDQKSLSPTVQRSDKAGPRTAIGIGKQEKELSKSVTPKSGFISSKKDDQSNSGTFMQPSRNQNSFDVPKRLSNPSAGKITIQDPLPPKAKPIREHFNSLSPSNTAGAMSIQSNSILKDLINVEEWYNIPPCILRAIEAMISAIESTSMRMKYNKNISDEQHSKLDKAIKDQDRTLNFTRDDLTAKIEVALKKISTTENTIRKEMDRQRKKDIDSIRMVQRQIEMTIEKFEDFSDKFRANENKLDAANNNLINAKNASEAKLFNVEKKMDQILDSFYVPGVVAEYNAQFTSIGGFIEYANKYIKEGSIEQINELSSEVVKKYVDTQDEGSPLFQAIGNQYDERIEELYAYTKGQARDIKDLSDSIRQLQRNMSDSADSDEESDEEVKTSEEEEEDADDSLTKQESVMNNTQAQMQVQASASRSLKPTTTDNSSEESDSDEDSVTPSASPSKTVAPTEISSPQAKSDSRSAIKDLGDEISKVISNSRNANNLPNKASTRSSKKKSSIEADDDEGDDAVPSNDDSQSKTLTMKSKKSSRRAPMRLTSNISIASGTPHSSIKKLKNKTMSLSQYVSQANMINLENSFNRRLDGLIADLVDHQAHSDNQFTALKNLIVESSYQNTQNLNKVFNSENSDVEIVDTVKQLLDRGGSRFAALKTPDLNKKDTLGLKKHMTQPKKTPSVKADSRDQMHIKEGAWSKKQSHVTNTGAKSKPLIALSAIGEPKASMPQVHSQSNGSRIMDNLNVNDVMIGDHHSSHQSEVPLNQMSEMQKQNQSMAHTLPPGTTDDFKHHLDLNQSANSKSDLGAVLNTGKFNAAGDSHSFGDAIKNPRSRLDGSNAGRDTILTKKGSHKSHHKSRSRKTITNKDSEQTVGNNIRDRGSVSSSLHQSVPHITNNSNKQDLGHPSRFSQKIKQSASTKDQEMGTRKTSHATANKRGSFPSQAKSQTQTKSSQPKFGSKRGSGARSNERSHSNTTVCQKCQTPCRPALTKLKQELVEYIDSLFDKKVAALFADVAFSDKIDFNESTIDEGRIMSSFYQPDDPERIKDKNFRLFALKKSVYDNRNMTELGSEIYNLNRSADKIGSKQKPKRNYPRLPNFMTVLQSTSGALKNHQSDQFDTPVNSAMFKIGPDHKGSDSVGFQTARVNGQNNVFKKGKRRHNSSASKAYEPQTPAKKVPNILGDNGTIQTHTEAQQNLQKLENNFGNNWGGSGRFPIISTRKAHLTIDQRVWDADAIAQQHATHQYLSPQHDHNMQSQYNTITASTQLTHINDSKHIKATLTNPSPSIQNFPDAAFAQYKNGRIINDNSAALMSQSLHVSNSIAKKNSSPGRMVEQPLEVKFQEFRAVRDHSSGSRKEERL